MTIEGIAIRQEIRQMLNEAGINKNVLSNMVKEVLCEEVHKVINQQIDEIIKEDELLKKVDVIANRKIRKYVEEAVYDRVFSIARKMQISVDISGE